MLKRSSEQVTERVVDSTTRDPRLNSRSCPTDQKELIRKELRSKIQEETYCWLLTQPRKKWNELPVDSRESSAQVDRIDACSNSPDTALRQQLRPGDHYNALLGFPGFFSLPGPTRVTKFTVQGWTHTTTHHSKHSTPFPLDSPDIHGTQQPTNGTRRRPRGLSPGSVHLMLTD